ncbi:unnamed protein product [Brassica rapa subsp. narinosa]
MLSRFEQMTGQDKVLLVHGMTMTDLSTRWEFPNISPCRLQTFVVDTPGLVFISDRHPSIATGLRKVYNHAQHVICVVHLWRNVMAKYKSSRLANLMSAAARAFTVTEFNKKFIEIQKISPNCAAYLVDIGFDQWTRYIRTTVMSWFALRRAKSTREQGTITPNVRKLVEENFDLSTAMAVLLLDPGTCTCGEYQLIGLPCMHALACSTRVGFPSDALVAPAYRVPTWREGFIGKIYPVPSVGGLELGSGIRAPLLPPAVRRPPRRSRKVRILSRGENEKARQTENENVVAVRDTTGHPAATQYDKL